MILIMWKSAKVLKCASCEQILADMTFDKENIEPPQWGRTRGSLRLDAETRSLTVAAWTCMTRVNALTFANAVLGLQLRSAC